MVEVVFPSVVPRTDLLVLLVCPVLLGLLGLLVLVVLWAGLESRQEDLLVLPGPVRGGSWSASSAVSMWCAAFWAAIAARRASI